MRPSNKSRSRNKSGNNPRRNIGNVVNRVFESAGPDGKVRGTPQQIIDKYQVLARDAQVSGDRVAAENYLQHAEHYARLLSEAQRANQDGRPDRDDREDRDDAPLRDDDRQHHRPAERQQEPAGLATFGGDERERQAGPVETPEEVARARAEDGGTALERPNLHLVGTEGSEDEPGGESQGERPEGEAPPKRTRSRRKKPAPQVAEAPAE